MLQNTVPVIMQQQREAAASAGDLELGHGQTHRQQHERHRKAHALGAGVEVDFQQVEQITGGCAQREGEQDLQQRLQNDADRVDAALLQCICHAVGSGEQHQTHGVIDGDHHQQQLCQRTGSLVLLDHHQGGGGSCGRCNGAQRDGRGQRDDVRADEMQHDEGNIHQRRCDDGLRDAHGEGLTAHPLQGAEPEFVADDEGDEAQRHLRDDAVAFHLCQRPEAEAETAQPQPSQKERSQQKPGDEIGRDGRQVDRLGQTGHQQTRDQRKGQTNQHLFHGVGCAGARRNPQTAPIPPCQKISEPRAKGKSARGKTAQLWKKRIRFQYTGQNGKMQHLSADLAKKFCLQTQKKALRHQNAMPKGEKCRL